MEFSRDLREAVMSGDITVSFRLWRRPKVKAGGRYPVGPGSGRIEVDSIKVRARTHAMRARGDAYFEHWREYLATVKNQQVRNLAEEHQPELKQSFEQLHLAATQVREGFRPFLSDLQKLRAVLEADPTLARIDAQKDLILAAKDKGRQVQQGLERVLAEMNSMTALLTPPGAAPKH